MADAPGFVGRYRVVRPLGQGRLGNLLLAVDPALDREVALRVLPPLSQERREQFRLTLVSIAQLEHPSLAPVGDLGEHQGRSFFTRQYIPGQPLSRMIAARTRTPRARRLEWLVSVCGALVYAHGRGLVGLVVEPSDLIIDKEGEAHIVDLGLGPLGGGAERDPSYQAPETIAGRAPDRSSDIFAAGVLLYELIVAVLALLAIVIALLFARC
jgi:serine/threonine protein kinase